MRKLLSVITAAACMLIYPAAAFADTENSVGAELVQTAAEENADTASMLNVRVLVGSTKKEAAISIRSEYKETLTEINIPETIDGYKIVVIDNQGFQGCKNLVKVTLPNTITDFYYDVFRDCEKLESINIPESVTALSDHAFYNCKSLKSVTIPSKLTKIRNYVFEGCESLVSINIPEGVTELGIRAFEGCCSLESVTLPKSIRTIKDYAFSNCTELKSINIPEGVTEIKEGTFSGCEKLENVTLPNTLETIGTSAFYDCNSLSSITIPDSVKNIEKQAFEYTGLTSITIPGSIEKLGANAFSECVYLNTVMIYNGALTELSSTCFDKTYHIKNLHIPLSLKSIGYYAFPGYYPMINVYYAGTEEQWNEIPIDTRIESNGALWQAENFIFNTPAPGDPNPGEPETVEPVCISINIPRQSNYPEINALKAAVWDTSSGNTIKLAVDEENGIDVTDLENGTYTLTVSAKECAERSYTLTVSDDGLSGEAAGGVELHLYGDADGDGSIKVIDAAKANAYVKGDKSMLTGYDLAVCDINQDGKVNIQDVAKINAHLKHAYDLWN